MAAETYEEHRGCLNQARAAGLITEGEYDLLIQRLKESAATQVREANGCVATDRRKEYERAGECIKAGKSEIALTVKGIGATAFPSDGENIIRVMIGNYIAWIDPPAAMNLLQDLKQAIRQSI